MTPKELINKYWPESIQPVNADEDLFEAVRLRVKELLNHDIERLLHTLYRVDVPEAKVKYVLSSVDPDLIDTALTELIIDRIREKIETRKKYSS